MGKKETTSVLSGCTMETYLCEQRGDSRGVFFGENLAMTNFNMWRKVCFGLRGGDKRRQVVLETNKSPLDYRIHWKLSSLLLSQSRGGRNNYRREIGGEL